MGKSNESKYNLHVCALISKLGYSYQDIADIYSNTLHEPCDKSAISKLLKGYHIDKMEYRMNPSKLNQKYIDLLQREGVYLEFLNLYNEKYIHPVKDTKFKSKG